MSNPSYNIFYNPSTQAQIPVPVANSQAMENLINTGWVKNPILVAMYNKEYKKHVMVQLGEEVKRFEGRGYFAEPTMIYHPKDGTDIVGAAEAKKAIQNGWYLSPAEFLGNSQGKHKTLVMKEAA